VSAVRRGRSLRAVAAEFGVSLHTVQRWVQRTQGRRLDRVDWKDRSDAPKRTRRTESQIERRILTIRRDLKGSVLGEYGARAIRQRLVVENVSPCPSLRTIGRILQRRGALDGRRRTRRPPPPAGWYLPKVAERTAELDSFDTIEGLAIRQGPHLSVLTGVSLHGGLTAVWPEVRVTSQSVVAALIEHWQAVGLPRYAQFDNDNRFLGPKQHPNAIGRVIRCCLSLGVIPVFVPPNEMGFQAAIESLNGRWQGKVWSRRTYRSLKQLQTFSAEYIDAVRTHLASRIDAAPQRRPFPDNWRLDLQQIPKGTIIFLRRTNDAGEVRLLGRNHKVDHHWPHRLVRAEVDLNRHRIRFYALRRREPDDQPLLRESSYRFPNNRFRE
jgi:putative transposase